MKYEKPFLSFDDQADRLISRGMECDRDDLIIHLKDVGYYRLSGYWYDYKNEDDSFQQGTQFPNVWDIYTFDRQFRLIVFDAIERVEVYFRTQLAHALAESGGPFGFKDQANLPRLNDEQYDGFIKKCKDKCKKSREPFVVHFYEVYGDSHDLPPYWMLVNTMDFGQMLTLYRGAPVDIRTRIASDVGLPAKVLESWLVTLNTTRNICAHHGRLWNRTMGTRPIIPKRDSRWHVPYRVRPGKVFCVLTMLSYILEQVAPKTGWRSRLFDLFERYPEINKRRMGFTEGWEKCPFWTEWIDDNTAI